MPTKFTEQQIDTFLKINIEKGKLKGLYQQDKYINKREVILDNSKKSTNKRIIPTG